MTKIKIDKNNVIALEFMLLRLANIVKTPTSTNRNCVYLYL